MLGFWAAGCGQASSLMLDPLAGWQGVALVHSATAPAWLPGCLTLRWAQEPTAPVPSGPALLISVSVLSFTSH